MDQIGESGSNVNPLEIKSDTESKPYNTEMQIDTADKVVNYVLAAQSTPGVRIVIPEKSNQRGISKNQQNEGFVMMEIVFMTKEDVAAYRNRLHEIISPKND